MCIYIFPVLSHQNNPKEEVKSETQRTGFTIKMKGLSGFYTEVFTVLFFFLASQPVKIKHQWFCLIYWLIDWRHNCISLSSIQAHYVICFMFCMSVFCFVLFYVTTCCYLFCCASQTPVSLHFLCFPENGTGLLQANQNNKHQDPQKCTEEANGFVLSLLLC